MDGNRFMACTLTGVEDSVEIPELVRLSAEFPFVEWGVLYSETRQGTGRYPSSKWIRELAGGLRSEDLPGRFALHVCGRAVGDFISGGDVAALTRAFGRIQLNLHYHHRDQYALRMAIGNIGRPVITQHNLTNRYLVVDMKGVRNHCILFDKSGGRGVSPASWPEAIPGIPCGYAGGLGPDNLAYELPKIAAAAGGAPFWIDMEGKLRDKQDKFDLARARACLEIAKTFRSTTDTGTGR